MYWGIKLCDGHVPCVLQTQLANWEEAVNKLTQGIHYSAGRSMHECYEIILIFYTKGLV